jgi:hypothetical protein
MTGSSTYERDARYEVQSVSGVICFFAGPIATSPGSASVPSAAQTLTSSQLWLS